MHRIVGLDITADELRIVALQSGFRGFAVADARRVPLPEGESLSGRISAALSEAPPLGDAAIAVAIPAAQVASFVFTLPFVDARRLEQVLPAEVEGAIPFDLDDVVWDHAVLSQGEGKTEVLVAVVKKATLRTVLAGLSEAGVDPRVVTFAPLALGALAERKVLADGVEGTTALIEAGPERAELCLFAGDRPFLARALSTSGRALWHAALSDPKAREKILVPLLRDIKISLRARAPGELARILLAGDLTAFPEIAHRFEMELGAAAGPVVLAPQHQTANGAEAPEMSLALALALRAQQSRGRLDFRKGEFAFTRALTQARGQLLQIGIAAVVLVLLAIGLGTARVASLSRQAADYDEALCAATKKTLGNCMTDYRQAVAALSGGRSKAAGIPRVSAADVLSEVVARLPDSSLPTIDDIDLNTTTVRMRGTVESFGKVDDIVAALRKDRCFGDVKQPSTTKARDGSNKINFSLEFSYTCSGELPGGA
ncbi:MAG: type II secretion system protein GspL [Myxococcales bacterium]